MFDDITMLGERQIGHGDLNIQPAVKDNLDSKEHIFLSPTTSTLQFSYPVCINLAHIFFSNSPLN